MAAILLSAVGALLSAQLTLRYLRVPTPTDRFVEPFCGGQGGPCDQVLAGKWAAITIQRAETEGGVREVSIPTALVGVYYFGLLAVWYLFVGRPNFAGRWWHLLPTALVLAGGCFSVWLMYVMHAVMGVVCPLCTATHVVNGGLVLVTGVLWPRRVAPPVAAVPSGRLGIAGITLALALALLAGKTLESRIGAGQRARLRQRLATLLQDADLMAHLWRRQEPRRIPIGPDDAVRGPADAEHTVVVFSDFRCPHCRSLSRLLEEQVRSLPGVTLRVVYKYHPLDRSCNDNAPTSAYPGSCRLAYLAEAVRQRAGQEAFWRIHDLLYENQKDLSAPRLRELAARVGIEADEFEAALSRASVTERVAACVAQAKALSVRRTPTVFLDGRFVEAWNRIETWESIFELATRPD